MSRHQKPWRVVNALGMTWNMGFSSELAAWNRIMASQRRAGESESACKARLLREGWTVKEAA